MILLMRAALQQTRQTSERIVNPIQRQRLFARADTDFDWSRSLYLRRNAWVSAIALPGYKRRFR